MTTWSRDEGPQPLKEEITVTVTTGVRPEDRALLEGLGLQISDAAGEAVTCIFPAGKGIMSLPSYVTDEALNEEKTRVIAHTLMQYFQVGAATLVCVSTRFALPPEGKVQPQWTTLSVVEAEAQAEGARSSR